MARRHKAVSAFLALSTILSSVFLGANPAAGADLMIDAPGWQVIAPEAMYAEALDRAFAAGDVTGDGRDDLQVVFSPNYWRKGDVPIAFGNSSFEVFAGGPDGLSSTRLSRSSSVIMSFNPQTVAFPRPAPNFDGDGYADYAIGGTNYLTMNGAYEAVAEIFHGAPPGFPENASCTVSSVGDANVSASMNWLTGGDYDGDGATDLLLVSTVYGVILPPTGNRSDAAGPVTKLQMLHGDAGCPSRWENSFEFEATEGAYPQVLGYGDFNGDRRDDLVIDETLYSQTGSAEHRISVLHGSATGPTNTSVTRLTITSTYSTQFAPGIDLDADGYGDLALLASYEVPFQGQYFAISLYRGGPSGLAASPEAPQTFLGQGYAVAAPSFGDVDGDGGLDLVLASSNVSSGSIIIQLDLFFGTAGLFPTTKDWNATVSIQDPNVTSGYWRPTPGLDASGDYDGDGRADLALAGGGGGCFICPLSAVPVTADAGVVLVYYGWQILRDVSGVEMVGFDRGVAHPTFEYGFNVLQKAPGATHYGRIVVHLPPGDLTYYTGLDSFAFNPNESMAPGNYVTVLGNSSAAWSNATRTLEVRFRFEFAWDFPSEDWQTVRLEAIPGGNGSSTSRGVAGQFRVEKDFAFVGSLSARDTVHGTTLTPGAWVAGSTPIELTGLTVSFEGAPARLVPTSAYNWSVADDDYTIWNLPGGPLVAHVEADDTSDPSDILSVGLTSLPDPGVSAPTATFAFGVDADAPGFADALPSNDSWVSTSVVTIGIVSQDPLSGVDISTLQYYISTSGPGTIGTWLSPTIDASDPHAVRARADAAFLNGEANYFRFRARDLVGNGYTESPLFQVRVDTLHVVFSKQTPAPDVWQTAETVTAGITVTDLGASGVKGSSVAFRTSTSDIFGYGAWTPVSGVGDAVEVDVVAALVLAQGDVNYVQWRAEDLVGTGLTISGHYQIRVDSRPVAFGNFTPDPADRLPRTGFTGHILLFDGGAARVAKSGVAASTVQYRFSPSGGEWGNWSAQNLTVANLDGTNWTAQVALVLSPGPDNQLEFRASDAAGNGPSQSYVITLFVNRAPTVDLTSNATNNTVFLNDSVVISALLQDPDGDELTFEWRGEGGRLLPYNNTTFELMPPLGNTSFSFRATDGYGGVVLGFITISVVERPVPPPPPPPPPPVQLAGDAFSLFGILAVLAAAAGLALYLSFSRRRRQGLE